MTTTVLSIEEAGAHLSRYVAQLGQGDRIILCRGDRPVAEVVPLPAPLRRPRPIGLGKGLAEVPETFFDPLPGSILTGFIGKDS